MTIIATAPVPVTNRLDDATTMDLFAAGTCPTAWCREDHTGPYSGNVHQSPMSVFTGIDPASHNSPATAAVWAERCDTDDPTDPEPSVPTRVVLSITEGIEGGQPGFEGTTGWTGTPEQAERLALALLEGARITRDADNAR